MNKKYYYTCLFYALLLVESCTWRKDNFNPDINKCDTLNISYSSTIKPIFENNCYSCHSTSVTSSGGGFDIENFASLTNYLKRNTDGVFGSQFLHVVSQSQGTLPMPPGYKLETCEINKIKAWINKGAPNN